VLIGRKNIMKKFTPNGMFQLIVNISGLLGIILQCFNLNQSISMFAGILVCFCILLNLIIWIFYSRRQKVSYGREIMIERGKKLISSTKNKAVLFGGDLSWTNDYLTEIKEIIDKGKEVLIFFPANKENKAANNINILKSLGAVVKSTPFDIGLRAILIEPDNPDDTIVFLTNRSLSKKPSDIRHNNPYTYTAEIFYPQTDKVVVNSFIKIYTLVNEVISREKNSNP